MCVCKLKYQFVSHPWGHDGTADVSELLAKAKQMSPLLARSWFSFVLAAALAEIQWCGAALCGSGAWRALLNLAQKLRAAPGAEATPWHQAVCTGLVVDGVGKSPSSSSPTLGP